MNTAEIWPLLLLSVAVSVDGLSVGIAYGLRNIKFGLLPMIITGAISAFVIYLTVNIGVMMAGFLSEEVAEIFGGILLICIGIWLTYSALAKADKTDNKDKSMDEKIIFSLNIKPFGIMINILKRPSVADLDNSGSIGITEAVILGFALAMDALGAGLGAGLSGISAALLPVMIGVTKVVFINIGYFAGEKIGGLLPDCFEVFPGIIIIVLGIFTIII